MENSVIEKSIHNSAYQLAKIEIGYDEVEDKNNQEKLKRLSYEIMHKEEVVNLKINELYEHASRLANDNGVNVPDDLRLKLALSIEKQITEGKADTIKDVSVSQRDMNTFLFSQVVTSESKTSISPMALYVLSNPIKIGEAIFDGTKLSFKSGKTLIYEKPENPMFEFTSQEELIEDATIEALKDELENLLKETDVNVLPKKINEFIESNQTGLGLDAILGVVESRLISAGNLTSFCEKTENAVLLNEMLDYLVPEKSEKIGFRDDNYTIFKKMSIFSKILRENSSEELQEKMQLVDKEIWDLIVRNPNIYEQLVSKFSETDSQNLAIVFAGGSKAISREETLEGLERFSEHNKDVKISVVSKEEPKILERDFESTPFRIITNEQKSRNLGKSLEKIYLAKGIKGLQDFVMHKVKSVQDTDLFMISVFDFMQKRNKEFGRETEFLSDLYVSILTEGITNPEIFDKAVKLNADAAKNAIRELISKQQEGSLSNEQMGAIFSFGESIKNGEHTAKLNEDFREV